MFQVPFQNSRYTRLLFVKVSCIITIVMSAGMADVKNAWELLLDNKPHAASEEFKKLLNSKNPAVVAECFRGLATVDMFIGQYDQIVRYGVSAYNQVQDIRTISSRPDILMMARYQIDDNDKNISKTISQLAQNGGLFAGWYQDIVLKGYLETGALKKAKEQVRKMGILSRWKFIGPFENISNCGFSNRYPPEIEIRFDKEYDAKNGNVARWHDLFTTESKGWIFLDNITNEYNSIFYFTTTAQSKQTKDVYLSFGASGTFKIFLNGTVVLQDSVYRNTGIDAYMQKVTLREGPNRILVKMGHEGAGGVSLSGRANFLLRFLDMNFNPVTDLQTVVSDTSIVQSKNDQTLLTSNSVLLDSLTGYLHKRLQKDSTDYDALLALISLYNLYEMTNESQELIKHYIVKKPSSSLLYSSLAESQIRSKKYTEALVSVRKAYDLCNLNILAWSKQLDNVKSGGNLRNLEEFYRKSPEELRNSPKGAILSLTIALAQKNRSQILSVISDLETKYHDHADVALMLMSIYASQGMIDKAIKVCEKQIKQNRQSTLLRFECAQLLLKRGNREGAIKMYQQAIDADPEDPDGYLLLSNYYYQEKKYPKALEYVEKCAELMPSNANILNLKGNILASMGRNEDAIASFKKTIRYTSDDFTAWDNIFRSNKKPTFEELTPLPSIDSIITASAEWLKTNISRPALIYFTEDIYVYQSRSTRSRIFLVMHLPNQQAIDEWKEYRIPFNPNYQLLTIDRAFSRKHDGSEIEADHQNNFIVFKSLEPGDHIVLEYSTKDYYQGVMAGRVYGTHLFGNDLPEFSSMIRMVTPFTDTIPYYCSDSSLKVSTQAKEEYRITTIKSEASFSRSQEAFAPEFHPTYTAVVYSNFKSWGEIADWYYELSRHKQKQTLEIKKITDSLVNGATTEWEKVLRIHEYMSRTINYSYIPFRQSAWIPQSAGDVFATRIGDCKDMSSMGKAIMDIAGIESWLVLVNTGVRHYTGMAHIGPNFDHCILSFKADGKNYFVDFTDRNTALGKLPAADQGAMALVIKPGNDSLITLPQDTSSDRIISRTIEMEVDSSGNIKQKVSTQRTGVYSSSLRRMYRFLPYDEQVKILHRSIADEYPDVVLDTLKFEHIDSLMDTLRYEYRIHAPYAAETNNSTIIFPLRIPDALQASYYPIDENREHPVDMSFSAAGITEQETVIECSFPVSWKLMTIPEPVTMKSDGIDYSLIFNVTDTSLTCIRKYKSNFTRVLSPETYKKELTVLKGITRADDVKLVFTRK